MVAKGSNNNEDPFLPLLHTFKGILFLELLFLELCGAQSTRRCEKKPEASRRQVKTTPEAGYIFSSGVSRRRGGSGDFSLGVDRARRSQFSQALPRHCVPARSNTPRSSSSTRARRENRMHTTRANEKRARRETTLEELGNTLPQIVRDQFTGEAMIAFRAVVTEH